MKRNYLTFCLLLIALGLKGQATNIFVHSDIAGFPDTAEINSVYTNIGFSTVNITSNAVDSTLTISNYDIAYIVEYYNYATASPVFLTNVQRQIIQNFIQHGGHVVWIAESIDNYITSPTIPPVNSNAITTINNIYGTNLSYGPFFNNGGMGSPYMPRIHPSAGPGGLSEQGRVLSSGSYATLLNVPSANAIYTSDFYDNTNFFDTCTHTTLALFPAQPIATEGSVVISAELGLPFHSTPVGPFGGPPFVHNELLDSTIAVLHFNLITNANMNNINSWSNTLSNTNANCPPCSVSLDSLNHVSCNGTGDGGIFISTGGGISPFTYNWSNGDTTQNISGLSVGTYSVTVTDSNNCVAILASHMVTEPTALSATTSATTTGCAGDSTGTIDLTVTGGVVPYTFTWSNGATTEDLALLSVGNYCVTVVDSNACVLTSCDSIEEPTFVIPVDTFYLCQGDTVQLQVNTNIGSINWTPSTSLSNDTISSPFAFPTTTTTYYITTPVSLSTNLVVNGDFESGNTGFSSAYTIGTGGSWGLLSNEGTYVINTNGSNTHTNFSPCTDHTSGSGNFMVVNGATIVNQTIWCQTVNISPNTDYQLSTWITSVHPTNPANLQFTINGVNIGNPFTASSTTCQWNQFFSTWNSGTNTTATLCITNQNVGNSGNDFGLDDIEFRAICSLSDSIVVIVDSLDVSLAGVTNVLCKGDTTGSISSSIIGNNYSYLWNTGDTTANLTNIGAGMYSLTVSNATGSCEDTLIVNLTEPDSVLMLSLTSSIDAICNGDSTGQALVNALGGTAPYTYNWSNTANTANITGLSAGTYVVTLTDANACMEVLSVAIGEPTALVATYTATAVSCNGTNDGTATVSITGGTPTYSYLWEPIAGAQTTATATGLTSNTYSVTITDNVGCTTIANSIFVSAGVPVDSTDVPLAVLTGIVDCELNAIGALGINTNNNYTYSWSNGETTQNISGLPAGPYSVTITNGLGCTHVYHTTIASPFIPNINPFITSIGMVTTTVTSGTSVTINGGNDQTAQGVTYNWTSPSSDLIFGNTTAHATTAMSSITDSYVLTLTATATDSTACQDTGSVTLNVESVYSGMPTAFSPNNDGTNDLYRPIGLTDKDIITFRVYNRWGQEIYNGDNLENRGWDGRFKGVEQPTEVYLFLLEYKIGTNTESEVRKGEFTLIR